MNQSTPLDEAFVEIEERQTETEDTREQNFQQQQQQQRQHHHHHAPNNPELVEALSELLIELQQLRNSNQEYQEKIARLEKRVLDLRPCCFVRCCCRLKFCCMEFFTPPPCTRKMGRKFINSCKRKKKEEKIDNISKNTNGTTTTATTTEETM